MASRFAARPTIGSRSRTNRRIAGRSAADYAKAYYEQQAEVEDEGEEEDTSVFPMWKSVAVAVIVIACFASIYPKLLHPLLMYAMGHGDQPPRTHVDSDTFHPSMRHPGGAGPGMHPAFGGPMPGAGDRFPSPAARAGRMPGMGGAAPQYTAETGRTGTWHWLLPFYTIGVVVFLIYTLGKILWRRPQINARHRYNLRYNSSKDRFEANYPGMDSEEEELKEEEDPSMYYDEDAEEDLRNEVGDPGPRGLGNKQLHNLQSRLQQTESAMQQILSQLEHLSASADPSEVERLKKNAAATLNNLSKNGQATFPEDVPEPSNEKKRRSAERPLPPFMDTGEAPYISDLEKALSDFKRLSDDYVKQRSKSGAKEKEKTVTIPAEQPEEGKPQAEVEDPEGEAGAPSAFDAMESDQTTEALTVEPGEGELISMDGDGPEKEQSHTEEENSEKTDTKKKNVRRRKGRKVRKASDGWDD